ncbi:uncharacterized protein GGS22DRAFT_185522 [Annulohypoxylon maeteangense]|uniref:uncharacterized protein n=1 Tax=Annulohypoxylon maeteangense TaxID=1927788 RepID=UPI0020085FC0|nr:uncharacterized protein GGS22DRAFT_185522 [Annulohypoxylon maeteangense]KAI0888143.1 hypothetical protein GGS22DRAFT_185522 [Annulohypoxylon maeteangense]
MPSIEGSGVTGTAEENVEGRQQKPKTLPYAWSTFNAMRELILKRSLSPAHGFAVGRLLDVG